ncbi:JAB domain-containing protein [Litchfieldia salsa]|uniref:JAB domain-containing protein n=1 Tax=Litchfieldia salsa TaxID=930152 RepID=UPI000B873076
MNVFHIGSLNASIVLPREVLKPSYFSNFAWVIVVHNHTSKDPTPSREEIEVTKRLVETGGIIGIDV